MKVLVFGASGYIGHEVALAFVRAGHDVFGATRALYDYKKLEYEEITPLICDFLSPSEYRHLIPQMDAVVDVSGGEDEEELGPTIFQATMEESNKARANGPPLSYIYCSGSWVHGGSIAEALSDRSPITKPVPISDWRAAFEDKVTSSISKSLTVNIIRPGMVYGGTSSVIDYLLFASAKQGQIEWYGQEDTVMPTVHDQDLGEAFRLTAEKAYIVPGITFDICNPHSEPLSVILARLKTVSHAKSIALKQPETALEEALACSATLKPQLAKSLLGWEAKKPTLADGIARYYTAYLASLP
ncbi:NAD(P)-binding protein [Cystobasidium minutum MCA 4210]|uniref:NAD(P)-binding protein n=1 Tax=Cystobasidium minutum MCA 4210 TaxID=1397322 RepID=UPI0034CD34DD|eukprot:jgi/Rhomi1/7545/CE7544_99